MILKRDYAVNYIASNVDLVHDVLFQAKEKRMVVYFHHYSNVIIMLDFTNYNNVNRIISPFADTAEKKEVIEEMLNSYGICDKYLIFRS